MKEVTTEGQIFNWSLGDDIDPDRIMVDFEEDDALSEKLFAAGFKPHEQVRIVIQHINR